MRLRTPVERRALRAACRLTREAVDAVRDARGEDTSAGVALCGSSAPIRSPPVAASRAVCVRSAPEKSCVVRGLYETGVNGGTDQLIAALIELMSMGLRANGAGSLHRFLAMGSLKRSERGWGETPGACCRGANSSSSGLLLRPEMPFVDMMLRSSSTTKILAQAKLNDSTGEPLPSWQGCAFLNEGQVFLLGDTAGSYDGRYFGVTRTSEIVGRADLLLTF